MRPRYPRWLQVVIGPSELAFCVAAWAVGAALGTAHACYLLAMSEDCCVDLPAADWLGTWPGDNPTTKESA